MYVQGYLLSSTVDFLAVDSWSLSYIWLLMVVGWFLPNLLILSSHVIVILTYRSAQTSTNHHHPPYTLSWLFRPHSRCSIKELALQMGDMTRTNFLKQRLMVKMKFSLRLNILTTNSCLQSEKKLWRATVMMLLTWTVAWTPYALMFLASISGHRDLISHHGNMWAGNVQTRLTSLIIYVYRYNIIILYFISAVLCKISVSVNPFIYGLM